MRKNIDITKEASREQYEMLLHAKTLPVPEDDEYPGFSENELLAFHKISEARRSGRQKQTVTLRLSPQTLMKARSLGKGYTSVLSRILEKALENPEMIKQFL